MARLWMALTFAMIIGVVLVSTAGPSSASNSDPEPAKTDSVGLVDPSTGIWHLYRNGQQITQFYFGNPGDFPMMGDWNCDGVDTPGLYRQSDGFVYLRNQNSQGSADVSFFFGNPGDVPVTGDFNANGCDTVSIYRPSNQTFYIVNELGTNSGDLGAADYSFVFGNPGDKPFIGDFNGDGHDTIGLHRESTGLVYFRNTNSQGAANNQFIFGDPGDRLVAGDWTGNGIDSPGLFRPSNATMYARYENSQGNADESWKIGSSSWLPVAGKFGSIQPPGLWVPAPGVSWQWQLQGVIDTSVDADVFDVDLFETPKSVIDELRGKGVRTICYLSAGSSENFRPDFDQFPAEVMGKSNGWPGEKWLDIRRIDVLGPIMEARLDLCKSKGFDGVEFDNVDGYSNDTGFALTASDQITYNRFLADAAHARGLSAGLKNDVEQAGALQPYFEFAVNEECFVYSECGTLSTFINAGKAVFHVEYEVATSQFCPTTTALGFSSMKKRFDLDAWRETCE